MDKDKIMTPKLGATIKRSRIVMQEYGKMYGKRIFTVAKLNIDLLYNKKKQDGQPVLNRPLQKFMPKPIDIYDIKLIEEDGSGEPCVIINNDVELKFPVKSPDFKDVTTLSVKEALNSDVPVFFADYEKLVKELDSLNNTEYRKAVALAEEFSKQAALLHDLTQQNEMDLKEYNNQLFDDKEAEVKVEEHTIIEES